MAAQGENEAGERWSRRGIGRLAVRATGPSFLEWQESGSWQEHDERPTTFRNRLRWTWDVAIGTLRIEHLRRGADRPIHLVDLVPDGADRLVSAAAHLCAPDRYEAEMILVGEALELRWEVSGPAKRYSLSTIYLP